MGTNYYFRKPLTNYCEHCGRSDPPEELHIGKSSGGWCFGLHVYPEDGIRGLADWEAIWATPGTIVNAYGEDVTREEMYLVIAERSRGKDWEAPWWAPKPCGTDFKGNPVTIPGYLSEADFHRFNHSERGPKGLLRHRVDGHHCIGHGPSTYDYIVGDFS